MANSGNGTALESVLGMKYKYMPTINTTGSDNGTSSLPRICHLTRQSSAHAYGFDFKSSRKEGRHVAINVVAGLPADLGGLRSGDIILKVNGESIERMAHERVVELIRSNPVQVEFTVVDDA